MPESPKKPAVQSKSIPIKRVLVKDPSEIPSQCSSTPGGTTFSTTPGGTRIVYDMDYLRNLRNSPLSKTPPKFHIPEHLAISSPKRNAGRSQQKANEIEDQFPIDL
ncbi:eukaryotic translation initiation factor 4E binding protein thor [Leptinotarsa decemlineata]|uniref:Eukaryotic translation initiation factor 4E-binding protein n=1 Tax=Leptinotarsa decemlineata TaxID=7539 RepID=A0A0K0PQK8_LEPDE|nr:eukaryotic translation initiation factor 4E-binding protein [Leptinotarsa decemlineata]